MYAVYLTLCCNCPQVHGLLRKASHNRAVAETKCNERSSRSHSVFRLKISGVNKHTQEACIGKIIRKAICLDTISTWTGDNLSRCSFNLTLSHWGYLLISGKIYFKKIAKCIKYWKP